MQFTAFINSLMDVDFSDIWDFANAAKEPEAEMRWINSQYGEDHGISKQVLVVVKGVGDATDDQLTEAFDEYFKGIN